MRILYDFFFITRTWDTLWEKLGFNGAPLGFFCLEPETVICKNALEKAVN